MLNTFTSFLANRNKVAPNINALTIIFDIPIPFTPRLAEQASVDTKNVSNIKHNTSLTPVRIYTSLSLPSVINPTNAN